MSIRLNRNVKGSSSGTAYAEVISVSLNLVGMLAEWSGHLKRSQGHQSHLLLWHSVNVLVLDTDRLSLSF